MYLSSPTFDSFHPRSFNEADAMYQEGFRAAEAAVPAIKAKLALRKAQSSGLWRRVRRFFR